MLEAIISLQISLRHMCRIFGSLFTRSADLDGHLVSSECSLLAQSDADRKRLQGDGWGIGHYGRSGRPSVVLSTRPVYKEKREYSAAAGNASGRVVIAHIRRASNPSGLPKASLLKPENQQPFAYRNWLFAHNGTLRIPGEVMPRLGRHRRLMKGNNDSEVYFWLLMGAIERSGSVRSGFSGAVETIWKAWRKAPAAVQKKAGRPYVGLNCVLSDGKALYALCKYDGWRPEADDNWLCHPSPPRPLFEMCYRVEPDGRGLAVASETTEPSGEWLPIKDGDLLEARLVRGRVLVNVEPLA
jgi:predicted glutamine amidotransferase